MNYLKKLSWKEPSTCSRFIVPRKSFLIASFPRSGTHYMTQLLRCAGIPAGHELHGHKWLVSWIDSIRQNADIVVHQLRHPLDVLRTCKRYGLHKKPNSYWKEFIFKEIETSDLPPGEEDGELRILMCWVRWNRLIQERKNPDLTYKIEDILRDSYAMILLFDTLGVWKNKNTMHWTRGKFPEPNKAQVTEKRMSVNDIKTMCYRWNPQFYTDILITSSYFGYDLSEMS